MNRIKIYACLVTASAVIAGHTIGIGAYSTAGYKWASWPVPFYVNASNTDVSSSAATSAVQTGMDVWNTQSGTTFRFSYAGQVNDTSTAVDGRNVVIFRNTSNPDSPGAVATTYSWSTSAGRFDTDIVFWDGAYKLFTGSSGCDYGAYIEDIASHELGHALGLMHSSYADATMYGTYTSCSTAMRTLSADDIAGAKALYPSSSSSTSNTAPTVSITNPASGTSIVQGTSLTLSGSASDTQDGNLTTKIAWTSSIDGSLGTGSGFSKVLSAGSHVITAKVIDSGGLSASQQHSVTVTASSNTAPSISITSPLSGTSIVQGTSLTFSGSATDTQDGSITAKIAWTSSIDGALGTGSGFSKVLSAGSHSITAKVTDSGGLSASHQISVTVTSTTVTSPSGATLTGKGYKVKGMQKADLTWSNLTATNVDIYRDGAKVMTTTNTGAVTDNIDQRGGGSYTYKVCATGTTTCTNGAAVSF